MPLRHGDLQGRHRHRRTWPPTASVATCHLHTEGPQLAGETVAHLPLPRRVGDRAAPAGSCDRRPLDGVRILEVAEHTFVPAASALLSDWGADVIKIEHVQRGDAMRGLASSAIASMPADVHVLFEHSNRGKRSLGLDLTTPDGLDILYRLAASADVFLTNKLPCVRTKLKIEVDDIRAHNPRIIYAARHGPGRAWTRMPTRAPTTRSRSGPGPGRPWVPIGRSTT